MYFADPYCAWQKGTNENLNGLLREFYPKGHNLSRVSPKTLEKNLALINARPKKILNFQKPQDLFELFLKKCCTWFDNSPKTVFISFLRQVEVRQLRNIYFGIDYDSGNPLNTKITEPRVQSRLCLGLVDKNTTLSIMVFNCLDLLQTKEFLDVFEKAAKLDFAIFSMTGNANNLYQSFISRRSIDERRKNEIIANSIAAFLF